MSKTFVLDTNVILHDPQALFRFEDNDLVIPMTVIEEIDRFKKELSETEGGMHVSFRASWMACGVKRS
jgi:PhoH-like ATPase